MKKTLFSILLIFCSQLSQAQVYHTVSHLSGTVNVGCNDVTVTSAGAVSSDFLCGLANPYWEGLLSSSPHTGTYSWHFSHGASAIRVYIRAIEPGDDVSFTINGTHFDFSAVSALSTYSDASCWSVTGILPTIDASGNLVCTSGPSANAQIDITSAMIGGAAITAVSITCQGGNNGVTHSMEFVSAYSTPSPVTVSGSGAFCGSTTLTASGGTGGTIYFQGTTSGGTSISVPSSSELVSATGIYYFRAMAGAGCWGTEGSASVNIMSVPGPIIISGGGLHCTSTTITAAGGAGGTIYYQGTTSGGTSTSDPSTSVLITASGTYYFRALSAAGCWGPEQSVVVTIDPPLTVFVVSGGGSVCGGPMLGYPIYLSGSTLGVSYQVYDVATGLTYGPALPGTGGVLTITVPGGLPAGTYSVMALGAVCSAPMYGTATMIVNPLPDPYPVTGGGTYCAGGSGVHIGVGGSALGINYRTYRMPPPSPGVWSIPVSGTGGALDLGLFTSAGTYLVLAVNEVTGCTRSIGTTMISVEPIPDPVVALGGGTFCGSTVISATGGAGGTIYYQGTTSGGTSTSLGGSPQTITVSGTYYFRSMSPSGCWGDEGSVTVVINPNPDPITGPAALCLWEYGSYASSSPGGTWSSGLGHVDFPVSTSGTGQGVSVGPDVVKYTLSTGCFATLPVVVNPLPDAVSTTDDAICVGDNTVYSSTTPGGTWSSSNTGVATVDFLTGVVTGTGAGTATISYILTATGCAATKTVYVSGAATVCEVLPIATCDDVLTFCGSGFTVDVSGAADGGTYTWNPSISGYSSMTCSVAGGIVTCRYVFTSLPATQTYTITSSAGCGGPRIVTIVRPAGDCYPCESFRPTCTGSGTIPAFKTITATTIDGTVISTSVPGYYYVNNDADLIVSPAPGSVFVMGQAVRITIPTTSNVTIDNCHMFSRTSPGGCVWDGIKVASNASASGQLTLSNSLIEHATVAGAQVSPPYPGGGAVPASGDILNSDNSIFNNNDVGISVRFYSTHSTLPFKIEGSVFTARNFCSYSTGTGATDKYPFVWPSASNLRTANATPTYGTDHTDDPAFNIDNYPAIGGVNKTGIDLMDVGQTIHSTPKVYHCIMIGDPSNAGNTNLFDTLEEQITSNGSNMALYNNIFRRPYHIGYGINALPGGATYANQNRTSLQLLGSETSGTNNRFYNCYHAVSCQFIYNFKSEHALITSRNRRVPGVVASLYANDGYKFIDSAFDSHEITENTIRNIFIGLDASVRTDYVTTANGNFIVDNNSFEGLTSSSGDEYAGTAVLFYSPCTTCTTANGNLSITNNSIFGWVFGVQVETINLTANIDDNDVRILDNSLDQPRIGIGFTDAANIAQVTGNKVYGDVANGVDFNTPIPQYSVTTGGVSGVRGFYFSGVSNTATSNTLVSCNSAQDVNIGFKFDKTDKVNWSRNSMDRNRIGMLLNQMPGVHAVIGDQGSSGSPADNTWNDASPTLWPGWGATVSTGSIFGNYTICHTLVSGENPASPSYLSRMTTRPASCNTSTDVFEPAVNVAVYGGAAYTLSSSILTATTGCTAGYTACYPMRPGNEEGIKLSDDGEEYTVFPNPTTGGITIQNLSFTTGINVVNAKAMNVLGEIVYNRAITLENGLGNLSLTNAAPGLYLLHITDEKGTTRVFKLVVQK